MTLLYKILAGLALAAAVCSAAAYLYHEIATGEQAKADLRTRDGQLKEAKKALNAAREKYAEDLKQTVLDFNALALAIAEDVRKRNEEVIEGQGNIERRMGDAQKLAKNSDSCFFGDLPAGVIDLLQNGGKSLRPGESVRHN